MANAEIQQLLHTLAQRYGLRHLKRSGHYLGIYHGLCIDLWDDEVEITFHVFSPKAYIKDQVLEQFGGFTNLKELGISTEWVKGAVMGSEVSPNTCTLRLSAERLKTITFEQLMEIPECLARDFHRFGASHSLDECPHCGVAPSTNLLHFGHSYDWSCDDCLKSLQDVHDGRRIANRHPVDWKSALRTLLIGTFVLSMAWGMFQQMMIKDNKPARVRDVLVLPFIGAVLLSGKVASSAGGSSWLLRLATMTGTVLAIVIANVWRTHTLLQRQGPVTFLETLDFYFNVQLLVGFDSEAYFLAGGMVGAWCGASLLKSMGWVKFE